MDRTLIIPVYLNQRVVFDMLAMLEGGIAHITRIASMEESEVSTARRFGAEFGLSKALSSLLSIGISGSHEKTSSDSLAAQVSEDRVHTPASLFFRLREALQEDGRIVNLREEETPRLHSIVEFTAVLARNPLVQTMDSMISLTQMAMAFGDQSPDPKSQQKRSKKGEMRVIEQMELFREKLSEGDSIDIIAKGIPGGFQAVVTLETGYLNDPTMADLADGTFTVIGKVTKLVSDDSSISLLRRTSLTIMPPIVLDQMMLSLAEISNQENLNVPKLDLEIRAPAMQIIPIAIFA